ncbi:hypothetical protein ILYODFUR_009392 [Ilyodon furcidens]|uniref:Uncharacterized protein n=1 Tax=Ilyodon furcidens TaxID=33524 RepID=A0ABV0VE42_9TELE
MLCLRYGKGSFSFSNLINGITLRFSTEFELQELKNFKEDNLHVGFGSATMALEQAIEKTTANIKWESAASEIIESDATCGLTLVLLTLMLIGS